MRVLMMAGGTGGHIMPALSIAELYESKGAVVKWLGTVGGLEQTLVPKKYELKLLHFSGVVGKGLLQKLTMPFKLLGAIWQARRVFQQVKPDVVIGMGGFPALPGGLYAWLSRTPLVIHEQNAVLGLTNKVLASKANLLLSGFPNVFRQSHTPTVTVGNPVRAALVKNPLPRLPWSERSGPLNVVVIGGSRGAKALNDALPQAMAMIPEAKRPLLTHQTGKDNATAVTAGYRELGVTANVVEFIDDMAAVYAQADLLICRSGASTVAELAVTGMPAILVPYPYHSDEQQLKNAHYLADAGAATLLEQKQLSPATLAAQLQTIDRSTLQTMSAMAQALGQPLASQQILDAIQQHLGVGP